MTRQFLCSVVLLGFLVFRPWIFGTDHREPAPASPRSGLIVSTPGSFSEAGLNGVAAISASNAWAVGYHLSSTGNHTLIEHYDGSSWGVVSSPSLGRKASRVGEAALFSVSAASAGNVWAVGNSVRSGATHPLIEHYDGTAWRVVASPILGRTASLNGVSTISKSAWAVGYYAKSGATAALIEHYDRKKWSVVSSPRVGRGTILNGIGIVSAKNVWAVGYYVPSVGTFKTLTEHYSGRRWHVVSSPNIGGDNNVLNGVAGVSATNVWAVGYYISSKGYHTLIEHYDGHTWKVVSSQGIGRGAALNGIIAASPSNVWAVGYSTTVRVTTPLVEHYDGHAWNVVPSPNPSSTNSELYGVSAVCAPTCSSTTLWAVGEYHTSSTSEGLIERYSGHVWNVVPSPDPNSTANS